MNALSFVKRDFVPVGFINSLQHFFLPPLPFIFTLVIYLPVYMNGLFLLLCFQYPRQGKASCTLGIQQGIYILPVSTPGVSLLSPECELAVTNVVFFSRMFMKNVCRILVCPVFVAEFFTQETKKFIALWPRVTRASKI